MDGTYFLGPTFDGGTPLQSFYESIPPANQPPQIFQQGRSLQIAQDFSLPPNRPPVGIIPNSLDFMPRSRVRPGLEHIKHKRTRSGCFTCRQRRVKCDEGRPMCERCKKGKRECVYPEVRSGRAAPPRKQRTTHEANSSSGENEDEEIDGLGTIPDEDGDTPVKKNKRPAIDSTSFAENPGKKRLASSTRKCHSARPSSQGSVNDSVSPSITDVSTPCSSRFGITFAESSTPDAGCEVSRSAKWGNLCPDLRFYLEYHQDHITHHHYFFKFDAFDFVHGTLVDIALKYEPLLYAVVGFAAYHRAIREDEGKIQDFLKFYDRSVSLLRQSLERGEKCCEAMLLTTLQLACFEEYLGDWISLIAHQKAAVEMFRELYTIDNFYNTEVGRYIFCWYARFDLFAGLMAQSGTILDPEWFFAMYQYYQHLYDQSPQNLNLRIEEILAYHRLVSVDMASLYARFGRGSISVDEFVAENSKLDERIAMMKEKLDVRNYPSEHIVIDFPNKRPPDPNDIVDPYKPGCLFKGPLSILNILTLDWYAISLMQKSQAALLLGHALPMDISNIAYEQCRIFEAIEYFPESAEGNVLSAHASLGLATLYLPKDEKHSMWGRKKLALIEQMGYIYPQTFRNKLSEFWNIPSLKDWWLPPGSGPPHIIRSIRRWQERSTSLKLRGPNGNCQSFEEDDIHDMKGIFTNLSLSEDSADSPESLYSMGSQIQSQGRVQSQIQSHQTQGQNWNMMSRGNASGFNEMMANQDVRKWTLGSQSWTGLHSPQPPYR